MPPCGPRSRLWKSRVPLFTKSAANSGSTVLAAKRRRDCCTGEFEYPEDPHGPSGLPCHPERGEQTMSDHQGEAEARIAASRAPHTGLDREAENCMSSRSRHEGDAGKGAAEHRGSPSYFREAGPTHCRCNASWPPAKVARQEDQLGRANFPASPVTLSSARGSSCASPCQGDSFLQCSRRGNLTNTPSDTSTSASAKSGLSFLRGGSLTPWPKQPQVAAVQVTLRDWFFLRCEDGEAGDVTNTGNPKIAVGGIYISESFERQVVRTTRIVERIKKHLLRTIDGVDVWLSGRMDVESTVANGFSLKVVQQFCTGFPSVWKPFLEVSLASAEHDIKEQAVVAQVAEPQLSPAADGCMRGVTDEQWRSDGGGLIGLECKDLETSNSDTDKEKGEELVCGSTDPEVSSLLREKKSDTIMSGSVQQSVPVLRDKELDTVLSRSMQQPVPLAHKPREQDWTGATPMTSDMACTKVSERELDMACTEVSEREAVSNIHEDSTKKNLSKNQKRRLNRRSKRKHKKQRIADAEVAFIADEEDQNTAQEDVDYGLEIGDAAVCQDLEISARDEGLCQEVEIELSLQPVSGSIDVNAAEDELDAEVSKPASQTAVPTMILRYSESFARQPKTSVRTPDKNEAVSGAILSNAVEDDLDTEVSKDASQAAVPTMTLRSSGSFARQPKKSVRTRDKNEAVGGSIVSNAVEDELDTEVSRDASQAAVPTMTLRSSGSFARQPKTSVRTPDKSEAPVSSQPRRRRSSVIPPPVPAPLVPVSTDMVSKAFGLKTSRSGRLLVPPLAFWRNQTAVHDKDGGIIAIMDGFDTEEVPDTGRYNFEPPTEKQAVRLQRKLHKVVQQLQSPSVARKGRS